MRKEALGTFAAGLAQLLVVAVLLTALPGGRAARRLAAAPPGSGAADGAVFCTQEHASPAASFAASSKCGAICQLETRAALINISRTLLSQSGLDWSNDNAAPFTTRNCSGIEPGDDYCRVAASVDLLPGDPQSFLFGVRPDEWLPSYCCWRGVVCCTQLNFKSLNSPCEPYSVIGLLLEHWPADIRGELQPIMDPLTVLNRWGLQRLDASGNYLVGTIPHAITKLDRIYEIMLGDNMITGPMPPDWHLMPRLTELTLGFNMMSGSLSNVTFCKLGNPLRVLNLRANSFTGHLDVSQCRRLLFLDAQDNRLDGPLGIGADNLEMTIVRLRNNKLSGTIPDTFWMLPSLFSVDLQNNRFVGTLSPFLNVSSFFLQVILVGNNSLTGTIPPGIGRMAQLRRLDLSYNKGIIGTLPNVTGMLGLEELRLQQTLLRGALPRDLGKLPYLMEVDIRNTLMTCCSTENLADQATAAKPPALLPPYLEFDTTQPWRSPLLLPNIGPGRTDSPQVMPSDWTIQEDVSTYNEDDPGANMQCPVIRRVPGAPTTDQVLVPADLRAQLWRIDPEYYWFKECACLPGFQPSHDHRQSWLWANPYLVAKANYTPIDMMILNCVRKEPFSLWELAIVTVICGLAGSGLVMVTYFFCCRRASKPVRAFQAIRKRALGMPKTGRMSVVVTDIEGYSDMMTRAPELMYRALTQHNNIIRKAKWVNCGFTLEQEGDSYALVFYEPRDAVGFCLQAQLMLNDASWPAGLLEDDPHPQQQKGRGKRRGLAESRSNVLSDSHGSNWFRRNRSATRHGGESCLDIRSISTLEAGAGPALVHNASGSSFASAATAPAGRLTQDGGPVGASVSGPATSPAAAGPSAVALLSRHPLAAMRLGIAGGAQEKPLFNGLRVRMGIATGDVPAGTEIKNSAVFELAKGVSDSGNGGQILMEGETFAGVRDMLHELGAIDASGLNYRKLSGKRTALDVCLCRPAAEEAEAIVLDMGEYEAPFGLAPLSSAATTPEPGSAPAQMQVMRMPSLGTTAPSLQDRWPVGTWLPGAFGGGRQPGAPPLRRSGVRVRLVQICAPPVLGRAKVFGNKLSLNEDWACTDCPYFDAPGAAVAPLGTRPSRFAMAEPQPDADAAAAAAAACNCAAPGDAPNAPDSLPQSPSMGDDSSNVAVAGSAPDSGGVSIQASVLPHMHLPPLLARGPQTWLPNVTLVFTCVEGAKNFIKRRRSFAGEVHGLLSALMREALRHVQGGYLCREQEGDLKYMVAFTTPRAALEWCLIIQEASMYLDWPESVLLHRAFAGVHAPDGELLFRGPRLKMGLCEGPPKAIMPDCLGRADYHGSSINQAARYMDAGAHGGQVVCESSIADRVMAEWAAEVAAIEAASVAVSPSGDDSGAAADATPLSSGGVTPLLPSSPNAGDAARPATAAAGDGSAPMSIPVAARADPLSAGDAGASALGSAMASVESSDGGFASASGTVGWAPYGSSYDSAGIFGDISSPGSSFVGSPPPAGALVPQAAGAAAPRPARPGGSRWFRSLSGSGGGGGGGRLGGGPPVARELSRTTIPEDAPDGGPLPPDLDPFNAARQRRSSSAGGGSVAGTSQDGGSLTGRLSPAQEAAAAAAAAAKAGPAPFVLREIPKVVRRVEALRCGLFRFKGNPAPVELVYVTVASLAARRFPLEPPKGKGHRLEEREGLHAAIPSAPLPALAVEYRARTPKFVLHRNPSRLPASMWAATRSQGLDDLRVSSMPAPVRVPALRALGLYRTRTGSGSSAGAGGGGGSGGGDSGGGSVRGGEAGSQVARSTSMFSRPGSVNSGRSGWAGFDGGAHANNSSGGVDQRSQGSFRLQPSAQQLQQQPKAFDGAPPKGSAKQRERGGGGIQLASKLVSWPSWPRTEGSNHSARAGRAADVSRAAAAAATAGLSLDLDSGGDDATAGPLRHDSFVSVSGEGGSGGEAGAGSGPDGMRRGSSTSSKAVALWGAAAATVAATDGDGPVGESVEGPSSV